MEKGTPSKYCRYCGQDKPVTEFFKHSQTLDGLRGRCKACTAEQVRRWRAANPEKYAAQNRRTVAKIRERYLTDRAFRNQRNSYRRDWAKAKSHKIQEHRTAHQEQFGRYAQVRRERFQSGWTEEGDRYQEILAGDPCSYCGQPATGVDHITPLGRDGTHTVDNLTACCARCNSRKRTKSLLIFLLTNEDSHG